MCIRSLSEVSTAYIFTTTNLRCSILDSLVLSTTLDCKSIPEYKYYIFQIIPSSAPFIIYTAGLLSGRSGYANPIRFILVGLEADSTKDISG